MRKLYAKIQKESLKLALLPLLLLACGSKSAERPSTESAVKSSNFTLEPQQSVYTLGTKLTAKLPQVSYDSAFLFLDRSLVKKLMQPSKSVQFSLQKIGIHRLYFLTFSGGKRKIYNQTVKVLSNEPPKQLSYQLINTYPHNSKDYTQGMEFYKGILYEGTGEYGSSKIKCYELGKTQTIKELPLKQQYFGEGITILNDKLYQLTWQSKKGFVYDAVSFEKQMEFTYSTQGWGIANDGKFLYLSTGTNTIYRTSPLKLQPTPFLQVGDHQRFWKHLNELEFVNGYLLANVYLTNQIVFVNPTTGAVKYVLNLDELETREQQLNLQAPQRLDVLNGIAYHKERNTLFVTGKLWRNLYELKLPPFE